MKIRICSFFLLFTMSSVCLIAEWPQWRGPGRDGKSMISFQTEKLIEPILLWESETIPSGDEGGFGSVVSDGKNAYLSIVWHRDVPTETRTISELFLRKFGARKVNLPSEIVEKAERDRLSLNPRLRGTKLDQWIDQWLEAHLDPRQKMVQGDLLASRFRQGKLALPVEVIKRLHAMKNKPFRSQSHLDEWLGKQGFDQGLVEKISQSVPPTKRIAEDVVLAMNLNTGKRIWKASLEGKPSGRSSSSTPCIDREQLFAVGSNRIFCIGLETGEILWDRSLEVESMATSPVCLDDKVIALVGNLTAFNRSNGEVIWENAEISGKAGSPITFDFHGRQVIACNSSKKLFLVDSKDGEIIWSGTGGGSSTPVYGQGYLLVHSKDKEAGLVAYDLSRKQITEAWRFPKLTRRSDSSPIIKGSNAYLIGAGMRACFDLSTGRLVRKEPANHDISSPVIAGEIIIAFEIKGNFLSLIDSAPQRFQELESFKINALRCTSPAIVKNKILIRKDDRVSCFQWF